MIRIGAETTPVAQQGSHPAQTGASGHAFRNFMERHGNDDAPEPTSPDETEGTDAHLGEPGASPNATDPESGDFRGEAATVLKDQSETVAENDRADGANGQPASPAVADTEDPVSGSGHTQTGHSENRSDPDASPVDGVKARPADVESLRVGSDDGAMLPTGATTSSGPPAPVGEGEGPNAETSGTPAGLLVPSRTVATLSDSAVTGTAQATAANPVLALQANTTDTATPNSRQMEGRIAAVGTSDSTPLSAAPRTENSATQFATALPANVLDMSTARMAGAGTVSSSGGLLPSAFPPPPISETDFTGAIPTDDAQAPVKSDLAALPLRLSPVLSDYSQGSASLAAPITKSAPDVSGTAAPITMFGELLAPIVSGEEMSFAIAENGTARLPFASEIALARPVPQTAPSAVAQQVIQAAETIRIQGGGTIEVSLSPEELGAVRITMQRGETGYQIAVFAERDETLNLLRRHGDQLEAAFRGMDLGDADISFAHGQNEAERRAHAAQNAGDSTETVAQVTLIRPNSGAPDRYGLVGGRLNLKL